MTQHINLLTRRKKRIEPSWFAVRGLLLYVLVMAGFAVSDEMSIYAARQGVQADSEQLKVLARQIKQARTDAGLDQIEALMAKTKELQSRLGQYPGFMSAMQRENIQQSEPPSTVLAALAKVSPHQVWVDSIDLENKGKGLKLTGKALNEESIVNYMRDLNRALEPVDIKLSALDVRAAVAGPQGSASLFTFRMQ